MATKKKSTAPVESIKLNYKTRAARARVMLGTLRPFIQDTAHELPLNAALELLDRVPHALNNAEAKTCIAQVSRLLPSILGLTEPRSRPY